MWGFLGVALLAGVSLLIAPLAIIGYVLVRWREAGKLSPEDERNLSELWNIAQRLEARVKNLETALDKDSGADSRSAASEEWRKE